MEAGILAFLLLVYSEGTICRSAVSAGLQLLVKLLQVFFPVSVVQLYAVSVALTATGAVVRQP